MNIFLGRQEFHLNGERNQTWKIWDLKLDFPTDEPTAALTAKKQSHGFDNSSLCVKQKM